MGLEGNGPTGVALNSKYTSLAPSRSESAQFDPAYFSAAKNPHIHNGEPISNVLLLDPTPEQ